jgi:hypothetical protein
MTKPPGPPLWRSNRIYLSLRLPSVGAGGLLFALLLTGCIRHAPPPAAPDLGDTSTDILVPGVVHRSLPTGDSDGIDLVDVDLVHAPVRIAIAAEGIKLAGGLVTGKAYTPHEWLDKTGGLAATNGGYFGQEVADDRKEIVGLLVQNGKVRRLAPPLHGRGSINARAGRYVRSAFGLSATDQPDIAWAATGSSPSQPVRWYATPDGQPVPKAVWPVRSAVGCGPMLVHHGQAVVTDREERLVSPGPQARTFVAYDGPAGQPRHFVLGMSSGMTYQNLAAFLLAYFPRYDKTQAADAMCLDGGASTQMSYRLQAGTVESPRETGVTVPDAIVILRH